MADYDKAIEFDQSEKYNLYDSRALVKLALLDYDGAIEDYKKAIEFAKKKKNEEDIKFYTHQIKRISQAKKIFKNN